MSKIDQHEYHDRMKMISHSNNDCELLLLLHVTELRWQ